MRKSLLIGSVLLLTTIVAGLALAASESPFLHRHEDLHHAGLEADRSQPKRVADRSEREDRGADRHDHEDEEDEDERWESRNRLPATGPADPNAPVPNNGLFGGKARPQVEVR
jgi:hypothetical protein